MRVVSFAQDLIYDVTRCTSKSLYLFCFIDSKAASMICHRQNESLFPKRFSSLFANSRTCNLRPQCLTCYKKLTRCLYKVNENLENI
jgi:hypothetical protein